MFPPTQNPNIDARAISGITGSISIACWVIVFSPQIIVNFRRGSAEGLSITFLVVWQLGDVFNVLGAVLQGVLPTMIILAAYYTLADIVLLSQCLYYKHRNDNSDSSEEASPTSPASSPSRTEDHHYEHYHHGHHHHHSPPSSVHLSPATPLLPPQKLDEALAESITTPARSLCTTIILNTTAVIMVCLAGIFGWYITPPPLPPSSEPSAPDITFSPLGQTFGYLCAVLYLFSRLPQIYLNYRRQTVEGLSLLFFLFACLGNLTYVLSIIAFIPPGATDGGAEWTDEQKELYWRYIAVNASWLLGSVGTLILDFVIFGQFFLYRNTLEDTSDDEDEEDDGGDDEGYSDEDTGSDVESAAAASSPNRPLIPRQGG